MSYENAIRSVSDSSYTTKSLHELRELLKDCMDIHGSNPVALHRITHAAEAIRGEISSRFLSGQSTWLALKNAVDELSLVAPKDHDIMIQVGDVAVLEARFIEPHSFLFEGINQSGHRTWIVIHFSNLDARIVYVPKRGPKRVITGFASGHTT